MEISKFQEVGIDNRETETNHKDESPMFDEEKEDREIRENMEIFSKFSCANLSSYASFFPHSSCLIQ